MDALPSSSAAGPSRSSRGALLGRLSPPPSATAPAASAPPPAVGDLLAMADQAQLVQADADVLADGLRAARRQLGALQLQLQTMQRQAVRQQQVLGAVLMERDCEVKLARSEAQAYRTAACARTAAVSTLQRCAVPRRNVRVWGVDARFARLAAFLVGQEKKLQHMHAGVLAHCPLPSPLTLQMQRGGDPAARSVAAGGSSAPAVSQPGSCRQTGVTVGSP